MSDPLNGPGLPAPRRPDSELEAPDFLGRPMPGTGVTPLMGTRLGAPGCLFSFLGITTIVLGVQHGSAMAVIGGVIILTFGAAAWAAGIRADLRRHREG